MSDNKFKKAWDGFNKAADKVNPIIGGTADVFNKSTQKATKAMNKGAKKTVEKSTDWQAGRKAIKCPSCRSKDVTFLENDRKNFSVGKAAAGGLLTGGIGTLAGFAGKKGKKDRWRCNNCGKIFKK